MYLGIHTGESLLYIQGNSLLWVYIQYTRIAVVVPLMCTASGIQQTVGEAKADIAQDNMVCYGYEN